MEKVFIFDTYNYLFCVNEIFKENHHLEYLKTKINHIKNLKS